MELTNDEIRQYLQELEIPEELHRRCESLAQNQQYARLYLDLRSIRVQFLENVHTAQDRLDQLDSLIYDIKKKREEI